MTKKNFIIGAIIIGTVILTLALFAKLWWTNSIHNQYNQPWVLEAATELGIEPHQLTQKQFNNRYDPYNPDKY